MAKNTRAKSRSGSEESCCGEDCCSSGAGCCGTASVGCCSVDAVVAVDRRGQMVLPKEVREKFGFSEDEKLAVVSWSKGGSPCCLTLIRAEGLAEQVRKAYGPLLQSVV